ncbi:cation-transporting P-type ATPase, partial [Muricomes intestini]
MDDHLQEPWHAKPTEDVLGILKTSEDGLSDAEAE